MGHGIIFLFCFLLSTASAGTRLLVNEKKEKGIWEAHSLMNAQQRPVSDAMLNKV